jgi:hypothetical protein
VELFKKTELEREVKFEIPEKAGVTMAEATK